MTLRRHLPVVDILRLSSRELLIKAAVIADPVRIRFRRKSLSRAATGPRAQSTADDMPPLVVLMVYRLKNVRLVEALLGQIDPRADIRLWALDDVAPELASVTLGSGPGLRFAHLNWLYRARPVIPNSWVVIADDDVFFVKGDLATTIEVMRAAGISLAQPGQSLNGWWTSLFTVSRPFLVARDTNYVEQGPIVIADDTMRTAILPFPEDGSMGWGIEAEWFRVKEGRSRIGLLILPVCCTGAEQPRTIRPGRR